VVLELQVAKRSAKMQNGLYRHIIKAMMRTDKATDYASWTFAVGMLANDTEEETGICFVSQSHSIPGEGKARNDMKNGQVRALSVPSSR
jgi:hypothetical protein